MTAVRSWVLRRARLEEPVVRSLVAALDAELLARYPEDGDGFFALDEADVEEGKGAFVVAIDGAEVLGCGAIRTLDSARAEVKRMYVVPSARGRGVARFVLAALEAEATRLGKARIVLETGIRQPEAIALYRSEGYAETDRFGDYPDSPRSVWMGKDLGSRAIGSK